MTTSDIPYGYCHCGCGKKTTIAKQDIKRYGQRKGEPVRYIAQHHSVKPPLPFTWNEDDNCWMVPIICRDTELYAMVSDEDKSRLSNFRWYLRTNGSLQYAQTTVRKLKGSPRRTVQMHRMIMNPSSEEVVDHVNGNGLDNRRGNLRVCNQDSNVINRPRMNMTNTSGYRGVSPRPCGTKWNSYINIDKRRTHLGVTMCPVEAAIIRDVAALESHGEFASLNFPGLRQLFNVTEEDV